MARALVVQERQPDASWKSVGVFLGTTRRIDARVLPGDARRDGWVRAVLDQASPPTLDTGEPGTWEDWIGWAINAFANGHDTWAIPVEPELTIDALYAREVLHAPARALAPDELRPTDEVPELGGYRKVRPT